MDVQVAALYSGSMLTVHLSQSQQLSSISLTLSIGSSSPSTSPLQPLSYPPSNSLFKSTPLIPMPLTSLLRILPSYSTDLSALIHSQLQQQLRLSAQLDHSEQVHHLLEDSVSKELQHPEVQDQLKPKSTKYSVDFDDAYLSNNSIFSYQQLIQISRKSLQPQIDLLLPGISTQHRTYLPAIL